MYIADTSNHRVRKVTISTGIITTVAGTGTTSYSGDNGVGTSATLYDPYGVALDSEGTTLYYSFYLFSRHVTTLFNVFFHCRQFLYRRF